MTGVAIGALGLALSMTSLIPGAVGAGPEETTVTELTADDDVGLFVVGNTLFAVYHEIGHALIDLLTLPVVGREEDAADGFAALMMIPEKPDPVRDELIIAVADGWRLQSDSARDVKNQGPLWGEHALDEQRYYAIVCFMVGSDQEGFLDFAMESGMPIERIERCTDDYDRMKASWHRLLGRHELDQAASSRSVAKGNIALTFEQPAPELQEALELARAGNMIEQAVAAISTSVALPRKMTVRFMNCGSPNGYWDGDRGEVLICYELVDDFISIWSGTAER